MRKILHDQVKSFLFYHPVTDIPLVFQTLPHSYFPSLVEETLCLLNFYLSISELKDLSTFRVWCQNQEAEFNQVVSFPSCSPPPPSRPSGTVGDHTKLVCRKKSSLRFEFNVHGKKYCQSTFSGVFLLVNVLAFQWVMVVETLFGQVVMRLNINFIGVEMVYRRTHRWKSPPLFHRKLLSRELKVHRNWNFCDNIQTRYDWLTGYHREGRARLQNADAKLCLSLSAWIQFYYLYYFLLDYCLDCYLSWQVECVGNA